MSSESKNDLTASLGLDGKDFAKGLKVAMKEVNQFADAMQKALGSKQIGALKETERAAQRTADSISKAFRDVGRIVSGIMISQGFYSVLNDIQDATEAVISFSDELDRAQISFEILLGNKQAASLFVEEMKRFAAVTPFNFEQVEQSARMMLAYGFQLQEVIPTLTTLMDASSTMGGSPEVIQRIAIALGQIKTNGRLMGQELRQLTEAGIPAAQILREELGLTADEIARIGDQRIPADTAIQAILTGMQKRYGGAAEAMAETYGGMLSTIKDNALLISSAVFEGLFGRMKEFTKGIRDFTNELYDALLAGGVGAVFETMFPPSLHATLRSIVGSFQQLGEACHALWKAIGPLISAVVEFGTRALGLILPPITFAVRLFSELARVIIETTPLVRTLAGVLGGLIVAGTAAAAVNALKNSIIGLAISKSIAFCVDILTTSIKYLTIAITRNPIIGALMLIVGALVAVALSSETASRAIDRLLAKLAALFGVDISGILIPSTVDKDLGALEDYLDGVGGAVGDVGDEAEDAGKKVKDKFLAAFDEVYNIPEMPDPSGGLGGGMDEVQFPSLGDQDVGGMVDDFGDKIQDALDGLEFRIPIIFEWNGGFGDLQGAFNNILAEIQNAFAVGFLPIVEGLRNFTDEAFRVLEGWTSAARGLLDGWVGDTTRSISGWVGDTLSTLQGWAGEATNSISVWVTDTLGVLKGWAGEAARSISAFPTGLTGIMISLGEVARSISGWAANALGILSSWAVEAVKSISAFSAPATSAIGTFVVSATLSLGQFCVDTAKSISGWVTDITGKLTAWGVQAAIPISAWALTSYTLISKWVADSTKAFKDFSVQAIATIVSWTAEFISGVTSTMASVLALIIQGIADLTTNITTFFANAVTWLMNHTDEILRIVGTVLVAGIILLIASMLGPVGTTMAALVLLMTTGALDAKTAVAGEIDGMVQHTTSRLEGMKNTIGVVWDGIKSITQSAWNSITGVVKSCINGIIGMVNRLIGAWNSLSFNVPEIDVMGKTVGGYTIGVPQVPRIPRLAKGGVANDATLAEIGEGVNPEAVIPLSKQGLMPFAEALTEVLMQNQGQSESRDLGSSTERQIMYVGTLIADDSSLKELERKMEVIRMEDGMRRGRR